MDEKPLERHRTAWNIVLGIVLVLAGLVLLGDAVVATIISITLIGIWALATGVLELAAATTHPKSGDFWSLALGGMILVVLGVYVLRNPALGALALTVLAGSLFLATGLTRIFAGAPSRQARWYLVISGVLSVLLGLFILLNLATATPKLLGIMLGIQVVVEGATLLTAGGARRSASAHPQRAEKRQSQETTS